MKIMINALSARQGGGQTYLNHLLENFSSESKNKIFIIAPESLKIPLNRSNIERIKLSNNLINNPFLRVLWERFMFPKLLKKLEIDVLFCPGGPVTGGVPKNCKIVITFQNMLPFAVPQRQKYPIGYMRFRNWILEKIILKSLIKSDFVIFISEYAKALIDKQSKGKIKQSIIIPHGVDPKFRRDFNNSLATPSWLPSEGYLLYVSILDVYKAQVEVVEAYAILKARRKNLPKLFLIGPEYGPYGAKVRKAILANNLTEEVVIIGSVPNSDLPAVYQNAIINIFASETENCPFILLEALAAGRPLLSSAWPPMPEFAKDAAIYFNPDDPTELANRLNDLMDNTQMMDELSKKGLERSLLYNWDQAAKKTWQAIENLV